MDYESYYLKLFKKLREQSPEEFRRQYLNEASFRKQVDGCETKAVRGDERCPEDGIERLIDDQTVYLCDKCYESYTQRKANEEHNKTIIRINI